MLVAIAIIMMATSLILRALDGVNKGFSFGQFFVRFSVIFILTKLFDIIFFDWYLLSNRGLSFFESYYPEVKPVLNKKLFGYNKKEHIIHIIIMIIISFIGSYFLKKLK